MDADGLTELNGYCDPFNRQNLEFQLVSLLPLDRPLQEQEGCLLHEVKWNASANVVVATRRHHF
jgi:hypothetical protein